MPEKIYSRFNRPATIPEPECPMDEQRYIEKIDKNGHSYLVAGDVVPFYENIQKYKDECDVYKVLERYEAGDPVVVNRLNAQGGSFGDFSDLPTDILDIKNKLQSAEKLFNNLTLEEREACDNNVNVFLANLTKGVLPESLKKAIHPELYVETPVVSQKIENKVETAVEQSKTTINDAVNGQGGAL